jgi:hypothetical protein
MRRKKKRRSERNILSKQNPTRYVMRGSVKSDARESQNATGPMHAPSHFPKLSVDMLGEISRFNVGSGLRMVNKTMRFLDVALGVKDTYQGARKGSYIVTEDNIARIMGEFDHPEQFAGKTLDIHLMVPGFPPGLREKILDLYEKISNLPEISGGIHTVDITLRREDVAGQDVIPILDQMLQEFAALPVLDDLKLELCDNNIGDRGCYSLLRAVETGENFHLKKLYLGLKNNLIGSHGAQYLSIIEHSRLYRFPLSPLQSIQIDLADNRIGNEGATWMAENMMGCSDGLLYTLHLNCKGNGIGDRGVAAFAGVGGVAHLLYLHINLDQNPITTLGLEILEDWKNEYLSWVLSVMNVHARNTY